MFLDLGYGKYHCRESLCVSKRVKQSIIHVKLNLTTAENNYLRSTLGWIMCGKREVESRQGIEIVQCSHGKDAEPWPKGQTDIGDLCSGECQRTD